MVWSKTVCIAVLVLASTSGFPTDQARISKFSGESPLRLQSSSEGPLSLELEPPDSKVLSAFIRSIELGSVLASRAALPAISSLFSGFPLLVHGTNFFSLESDGKSNAEHIRSTLEEMGPTYVKFGQALATRPDIIPQPLADALLKLQDQMEPFDNGVAKAIIQRELSEVASLSTDVVNTFVQTLSSRPVASASIGVVYKGFIKGYGDVAVKVKRPGIRQMVERDAALLKLGAEWLEKIPNPTSDSGDRLIAARVANAVDEFMSRMFEELDYRNEAKNLKTFSELYSHRGGSSRTVQVFVPEVILEWCTGELLVMEWVDCEKLDISLARDDSLIAEELRLVEEGIACTLSQLFETGVLHADPHLGNIIKVPSDDGGPSKLGYLDFGILATVPQTVRDGVVCAIVQLVFARNVGAVAELFGELQLLPASVLEDPVERMALSQTLEDALEQILVFPPPNTLGRIPTLRFDNLLTALFGLVTRFQLTLPPYFLNNARALATLEGIARRLDPSFNVLTVVYPFVFDRMVRNPSMSPIVEQTILDLIRSPETNKVDRRRLKRLLQEASVLSGNRKRKVVADIVRTPGGRKLSKTVLSEYIRAKIRGSLDKLPYKRKASRVKSSF